MNVMNCCFNIKKKEEKRAKKTKPVAAELKPKGDFLFLSCHTLYHRSERKPDEAMLERPTLKKLTMCHILTCGEVSKQRGQAKSSDAFSFHMSLDTFWFHSETSRSMKVVAIQKVDIRPGFRTTARLRRARYEQCVRRKNAR